MIPAPLPTARATRARAERQAGLVEEGAAWAAGAGGAEEEEEWVDEWGCPLGGAGLVLVLVAIIIAYLVVSVVRWLSIYLAPVSPSSPSHHLFMPLSQAAEDTEPGTAP
ncbi:unnamed protein product [Closterium sp. NIES-65]|nr:unnamed protein product [Closterium sp. NIES-65]